MISGFIAQYGGNIISLHEHVDSYDRTFFLRVVWDMDGFDIPENELDTAFNPVYWQEAAHCGHGIQI